MLLHERCSVFLQIKSYYGISRNLLIKFKDDGIDETSTLAQVLSSESAISSMLDMSIRLLPGDHGLPLQQVSFYLYQIFILKQTFMAMNPTLVKMFLVHMRRPLVFVHFLVKEANNLDVTPSCRHSLMFHQQWPMQ